MSLQKIVRLIALLVGILGIVFWILLLGSTDPYTDIMINIAKILVIVTAAVVLLFTLLNLVSHPKKLKKALIAVVSFLIVVLIGYALAKGNNIDLDEMAEKGINVTESTSRTVGAGLITFYILAILAAGIMIFSGIGKFFKK